MNVTGKEITEITLKYPTSSGQMELPIGGEHPSHEWNDLEGGTIGFGPDPIPASVLVSWTTYDGVKHQQPVAVAARIPDKNNWSGTIWFRFEYDRVLCIPDSDQERDSRAVNVAKLEHRLGLDKDAVLATEPWRGP